MVASGFLYFFMQLATVWPAALSQRDEELGDFLGRRFRCNNTTGFSICLSALKPSCQLRVEHGKGLPGEPSDQLILTSENKSIAVKGPAQMKGCVTIRSSKDALEYLRFFSTLKMVDFFDEDLLEIYPARGKGCYFVCLPEDRWRVLGLEGPIFHEAATGIQITRLVIKPASIRHHVTVFRLTQEVRPDGEIHEIASEPVSIPTKDLLWLRFPAYL